MFHLIGWVVYGLFVGYMAKLLHPGNDEPIGLGWTLVIGVAGSFIGGLINFILTGGSEPFSPSGFILGIIGGVIFCYGYSYYKLNK